MTGEYKDRVCKAFEKLHLLQQNVEDEKVSRYRLISTFLSNFENKLEDISQNKSQKFDVVLEKLRSIAAAVAENRARRERTSAEINKNISSVQKNCLKLLESNRKDRVQVEKRIAFQLNSQLDLLATDINKRAVNQNHSNYIDVILQEDIVRYLLDQSRLKQELSLETSKRRQVEERIFNEFTCQMATIKQQNERDKLDRHDRQDQIVNYLKQISQSVKDNLYRMKKEREYNESQAVNLIESIIDKLKKQLTQMRY